MSKYLTHLIKNFMSKYCQYVCYKKRVKYYIIPFICIDKVGSAVCRTVLQGCAHDDLGVSGRH